MKTFHFDETFRAIIHDVSMHAANENVRRASYLLYELCSREIDSIFDNPYPSCAAQTYAAKCDNVRDKVGNIFGVSDHTLTFIPANKLKGMSLLDIDAAKGSGKGFVTAKIGKTLRSIFKAIEYPIDDTIIESFVNEIKSRVITKDSGRFIIVRGEKILEWYHEDSYADSRLTGDLGNSCMRYAYKNNFMRIYANNPRTIGLLCFVNNNHELLGRAIVWNTDKGIFMDRAYGHGAMQIMFRNYARENGWAFKKTYGMQVNADGTESPIADMVVSLESSANDLESLPYMDTFVYLSYEDNCLRTYPHNFDVELLGTEGTNHNGFRDDIPRYECASCGDVLHENTAYFSDHGDSYCYDCYHDGLCAECGYYVGSYEIHAESHMCGDCHSEHYCRDCDNELDTNSENGLCEACFIDSHCRDCGGELDDSYRDKVYNYRNRVSMGGDGFCNDCQSFAHCSKCGTRLIANIHETLCNDCYTERQSDNGQQSLFIDRDTIYYERYIYRANDENIYDTGIVCHANIYHGFHGSLLLID